MLIARLLSLITYCNGKYSPTITHLSKNTASFKNNHDTFSYTHVVVKYM